MSQFLGPHITVQAWNHKKYQMFFLEQHLKYWKQKVICNLHLIWDARHNKEGLQYFLFNVQILMEQLTR